MNKIKLNFETISEIVGSESMGLIILVDDSRKRQLTIPCDKWMMYQFGLRQNKEFMSNHLLPEVFSWVLKNQTNIKLEIVIESLIEGQFKAILNNVDSLVATQIRVSDAVLLSMVSDIPIYIEENLMHRQSVEFQEKSHRISLPVNTITDEMLQQALDNAINSENYELASHLRDEMEKRKHSRDVNSNDGVI